MGDISTHLDAPTIDNLTNAEEARVKSAIQFGLLASKMFIQTQLFISGIREVLHH